MKKSCWLFLIMLLVCSLCCPAGLAEETSNAQYVTTIYHERNGLPTGEANAVYQTGDNYVWIGSYGGLVRYDGTTFVNYSQEGRIPSSSIRALTEDGEGRLWVGTNDAGLFVYENNMFTRVEEQGEPVFLCIRDIIETMDGTVYAASSSGLARVENGYLVPVAHPALTGQTVYTLGADAYGRVWAVLNDWQCAVVDGDQVIRVLQSAEIFPDGQQIYAVASDEAGDVYLGTYQNTVARLSFANDGWEKDSFSVEMMDTGDVTIHNALTVTREGDVLVCGQMGFAWIDANGKLHTFSEDQSATALNDAMMDYEGNLWLASSAHGVIKYTLGTFDTPNVQAALEGVAVNTVFSRNGRYYLGMDSGLMIFDRQWQRIDNKLTDVLAGVRVRQVTGDKNGRVWVATYSNHGLICYDPGNENIVYFNQQTGMENCWSRTAVELKDGSMAVGTSGGLYIIRDDAVAAYYGAEEGLKNLTVLCLAQAQDDTLFIGTDGGGMYALKDNRLTHYGSKEGLAEGVVLRILPDGQEGLFVSAGSSLYYWQNGLFRKLDQFEKAAGSIFDFYLKDGKLWLLQNSGILSVDKEKLLAGNETDTVLYSFSHGLTGSLNANTWNHLTEMGTLYMATRNGISVFDFQGVEGPRPVGIINGVWVDGEVYEHPDRITLKSDARRLTVDFAMLSYTDTAESSIAYRLEGVDGEETVLEGKKSGSISYTNLPGGSYTFHMRTFNPDHPEDAHHVQVEIIKEKKWTEQPLFWVLVAILFALVLAVLITTINYLAHRARLRRMQERQKELQAILVQSLQAFARVIDAKDPYTNGHSVRVARYARELARRMGLSAQEQERIYYVAMLHDIGKIGIPDHILNKQGALTDEERAVIQTHPAVGGHVLEDFTALEGIADGARYHHERFDGKGYCEGKKGEEIPLVARIIGVADSYDAMSSDRCYRPALSREKIIAELKEHSGTQFDPGIVPHMLAMIEEDTVPDRKDLHGEAFLDI